MILLYSSLRVGNPDREAFDAWFRPLCKEVSELEGCVLHQYWTDPEHPERRYICEAWVDADAFNNYSSGSAHTRMYVEREYWQLEDCYTQWWANANGHELRILPEGADATVVSAEGAG
jgi:quinol monooxygenase YgiN